MVAHCVTCAGEINTGGFDLLFSASCLDFAVSPIARFVTIPSILYLQEPKRSLYEANPMLPLGCAARRDVSSVAAQSDRKRLDQFGSVSSPREGRTERRRSIRHNLGEFRIQSRNNPRVYGLEGHVCYLGIDTESLPDH
jgi:hypothetical protein